MTADKRIDDQNIDSSATTACAIQAVGKGVNNVEFFC